MKVIKPSIKIETPIDEDYIYKFLERCGRTAYQSESKITEDSAKIFLKSIIRNKHESILEHISFSVRIICDLGVANELVRHRIMAVTQNSTRYIKYTNIEFIKPCFWDSGTNGDAVKYIRWVNSMKKAEDDYKFLIESGASPQEARSVLPKSTKTELVITANIREFRHILKLRTDKKAHPQMQEIMNLLLDELEEKLPVLFGDIRSN